MDPKITEALNKDKPDALCVALLDTAKAYVKSSRCRMGEYYDKWDFQDMVYRGEREPDKEDQDQDAKGKPVKMIIPNTFAQVQVFISFLFLLYRQNRTFYELTATGDEDVGPKKRDAELILERDLRKSAFNTVLYQNLADIGIRGVGFTTTEWVRRTTHIRVPQQPVATTILELPVTIRGGSEYQEFVKFEGNEVRAISPYRAFPDVGGGLPLQDAMRRGRFFAYEEEYSMTQLRDMQRAGEVAGVENIQPLTHELLNSRGATTRSFHDFNVGRGGEASSGHAGKDGMVLVTKVKMWLIPHEYKYDNDRPMGPEEFPILYHVWYANDNTLIRCDVAEEWHGTFGTTAGEFTADMHHTLSQGLADLIYRLQDLISWFLNSHVKSVRQMIRNRFLINVDAVDTKTLDSDSDVYTKQGFGRRPLNDALQQLNMTDVTGGHMTDAQICDVFMKQVTGINDNLTGQISSGRRSAQENRVVNGAAAGRMKLHAHLIWEQEFGALGEMMLSNSRQSISEETFNRIIGASALAKVPDRYAQYKGTPQEVICSEDFMVFDSTLQSDKPFAAQALQELLQTIMTVNPQAALMVAQQIDPVKMLDDIQYLRTGATASRYRYEGGTKPPIPPPALVSSPPAVA